SRQHEFDCSQTALSDFKAWKPAHRRHASLDHMARPIHPSCCVLPPSIFCALRPASFHAELLGKIRVALAPVIRQLQQPRRLGELCFVRSVLEAHIASSFKPRNRGTPARRIGKARYLIMKVTESFMLPV